MGDRRTRRRFTREFKARAVQHLLDRGKALSDVAGELGVSPGQLSQWRNEQLVAGSAEALAARKAEQAETQRLRREVKRREEQVEILRKAAAFLPGGSRDQVRLCVGREGEPRRDDAVPGCRC
jgi:transposase